MVTKCLIKDSHQRKGVEKRKREVINKGEREEKQEEGIKRQREFS